MPRALPGTVATLLAIASLVPPQLASAQILPWRRGQQAPAGTIRNNQNATLPDGPQRLEEMKVQLALLNDVRTFRYDLSVHAKGKSLELSGSVPNDVVRQRILDLAHRHTMLTVNDQLKVQDALSVRQPSRPADVLKREGFDLLLEHLGEMGKQVSVEARPDGVIVLSGQIDSLESKVEAARSLRGLSGCTGVDNRLTPSSMMFDGQRMIKVTRNGSVVVQPSMIGPEPSQAPAVRRQAVLPPPPRPSDTLAAKEGELRLPITGSPKQPSTPIKTAQGKTGDDWEAFAPSKLPVKWGRPSSSLDAQAKDLESVHSPTTTTAKPLPPSADPWTAPAASLASKASQDSTKTRATYTAVEPATEPEMSWRAPGVSEESEPKSTVSPREETTPKPQPPPTPTGPALYSSRRWPPAYVTGPQPSKGRFGFISFEDLLSPSKPAGAVPKSAPVVSKPTPTVIATSHPVGAANLQQQVKALCGRQAREVTAAVQQDGSVLIKVKVANRSIEDQLSRKILSLPDMTAPKVRLLMEIEP